jgi:hypothetical protein
MSSTNELLYRQTDRYHESILETKTSDPLEPSNKDEEALQQERNSEELVSTSRIPPQPHLTDVLGRRF